MTVFHRFGVLWDETCYTFTDYVSKRPEFILISTAGVGYRHVSRAPVKEAFDVVGKDDFAVDCVRVFDLI